MTYELTLYLFHEEVVLGIYSLEACLREAVIATRLLEYAVSCVPVL